LSLASLNAAIQNKPHLIIDRLAALQPLLYQETVVRPELKREVMMGPFKSERVDTLGILFRCRFLSESVC
jgi:cullin-associated NEDD8-dissociated protein 1